MPPKQDELRGIKPTRQAVQFEFWDTKVYTL